MVAATAVMTLACWGLKHTPLYPRGEGRLVWGGQLAVIMGVGAGVYFVACAAMGMDVLQRLMPRRGKNAGEAAA
jgi:hypothetical protein